MSNQQCHKLHEMTPSPMNLQPQACAVCSAQFMPNYQTLTCTQCNESLCLECVLLYSPETAFPMHLAKHCDPCALQHYTDHRDSAIRLMRDPFLAQVYHEYQRFYNTDAYHQARAQLPQGRDRQHAEPPRHRQARAHARAAAEAVCF
jgi:hypothetical protein